jgi:hypothetical protein
MTHDKKLQEIKFSFSPVSLKDAEKSAQLDKNLEMAAMQEDKAYLPASLEDDHEGPQNDQTVSPALRDSTPALWIFGLMRSTPCV